MARDIEPTWDVRQTVPGGKQLRQLRQEAGLSLMELANRLDDAGLPIDAAHLQRIESGKIARPNADTVDAILTIGLDTPWRLRRNVLDAYGYRLPWALPTPAEIEDARRLFAQELEVTTWPAYLMDHGHRIWSWNRYGPRLLGVPPGKPMPDRYTGMTTLDFTFNPALGLNLRIANADSYQADFLRSFKVQTQPYAEEPWFAEMIDRAGRWPGFARIWEGLSDDPDTMMMSERIYPIAFRVPGYDEPLTFRIVLIYLSFDPRFQIISWIPYGAATMRHVAQWAEDAGEM